MMLIAAAAVLLAGTAAAVRFWLLGEPVKGALGGKRFGMVDVTGFIGDSRDVNDFIATLRDDPEVVGVVLRINSPGGAVGPAQEIHRAVRKLAAVKPVVASMSTVAASGGYYVACPATKIMANPATLTASIGVKMQMSNLEGLMDKLGIGHQALTSGALKDAGSPYRPMAPEERAYFQALIMDMYDQFVLDVAEGRKMAPERVRGLADGRVMTGRQALEAGLVDKLGGLEDAFDLLRELAGVHEKLPVTEGPKRSEPLLARLLLGMADAAGLADVARLATAREAVGPRWEIVF
jgi:protease-4